MVSESIINPLTKKIIKFDITEPCIEHSARALIINHADHAKRKLHGSEPIIPTKTPQPKT